MIDKSVKQRALEMTTERIEDFEYDPTTDDVEDIVFIYVTSALKKLRADIERIEDDDGRDAERFRKLVRLMDDDACVEIPAFTGDKLYHICLWGCTGSITGPTLAAALDQVGEP